MKSEVHAYILVVYKHTHGSQAEFTYNLTPLFKFEKEVGYCKL